MNRNYTFNAFVAAFAAALPTLLVGRCPAAELPEKPNLIYIMCDDLGYGDLGCFGQKTIVTPNLDRLANEGMRLTSYYAGCTVCRPSRLVLWTGMHTGHTAISSNAPYTFQPSDVTVAELLHDAGYVTGGVGKWAMGGVGTTGHPNQNGFDFWMGYLDQGDAHNYYPTHLWRNEEKVPLEGNLLSESPDARGRVSKRRTTYSHDLMTDAALDFVRQYHTRPFLLHVHWTIPHANNEGGRVTGNGMEIPDYGIYTNQDWPNTAKGQAAMITRMDGDVGRLIALLRELRLDAKTLLIFTSDNGPHSEGGHRHEYFDANGPLRGYKRDLYEGGIREPTIAWWPGVIKAGSESDQPLGFWDFLPTACQLAGLECSVNTDGISFVPTLVGESQPAHEYLYWRYEAKEAVRTGKWKGVRLADDKPIELYDLTSDIGESNDVSGEHPEIVAEIRRCMADARRPAARKG
ncbi:MAG: arylsulfatase [Planctomycetaceae bacterium]|nr:arylsulfatase [Planctomycetales bacterium]MCB9924066.1 arylsulfatase [Planctomycetaceae bacterium]